MRKKIPTGGAKHLGNNHGSSHVNFLPDASPLQLMHKTREILFQRPPNSAELDFKVGRRAFEAGVSQKEIALMLAAGSPTVKQMMQGQRKVHAPKYVNRVAQLSCQAVQQPIKSRATYKRKIELGD